MTPRRKSIPYWTKTTYRRSCGGKTSSPVDPRQLSRSRRSMRSPEGERIFSQPELNDPSLQRATLTSRRKFSSSACDRLSDIRGTSVATTPFATRCETAAQLASSRIAPAPWRSRWVVAPDYAMNSTATPDRGGLWRTTKKAPGPRCWVKGETLLRKFKPAASVSKRLARQLNHFGQRKLAIGAIERSTPK